MCARSALDHLLPELRAYARSLCGRADAAEDLVQDAVERSLKSGNVPGDPQSLRPWMFRVIRNLHYDELRKRRIRREYVAREKRLSAETGDAGGQARDALIKLQYERLPPDKREVLFLVDIMGLKYAEAAEVMGVATGTVMSRLSRARQALRLRIDADERPGSASRSGNRHG
ncbi:MAG: RNA polymerase sigma factor [Rhodobacteraceae bacterium]|nr:RNA polymerase sigma factor [Paracoccaceae bacterium]